MGPKSLLDPADFQAFFAEHAGLYLVLTPDLRIVDASDDYLRATLTWREEILGCLAFDAFPENPSVSGANATRRLRASLHRVATKGVAEVLPTQRYDMRDRVAGDGAWVEKHWVPVHFPVFGRGSREITHIVLHPVEITGLVRARRALGEELTAVGEQRATVQRMLDDVARRERELESRLDDVERALRQPGRDVEDEGERYLAPGDRASGPGRYELVHRPWCAAKIVAALFLRADEEVPSCHSCGVGVRYRLMRRGSPLL
jgi:hypothetical protein